MFYSKKLRKCKKITHCFFSRKGGFSKGIYKSLNCGIGSKDKKSNIKKNLKIVNEKVSKASSGRARGAQGAILSSDGRTSHGPSRK